MMQIEQLKKPVDFDIRECTKCIKNSADYKKPHHPTCLDAKAWTPAAKEVLDATTDWEKQKLNMLTKNAYVKFGLLPRSTHKFKQPPPSTVTEVVVAKTNVTKSAVAKTPSLDDARCVERKESPPLQAEALPPQKLGAKGKFRNSYSRI
jgi:hypothetical protein